MQIEVATTPFLIFLTASVAIVTIAALGYTSVNEKDSTVLSVIFCSITLIAGSAILGIGYREGKAAKSSPAKTQIVHNGRSATGSRSRSPSGSTVSSTARGSTPTTRPATRSTTAGSAAAGPTG